MKKTYVIVGGVAGGATAAAKLRREDEQAEIIIFERGHHVSFANCGLPYFIGGQITDRSQLLLMTPEVFWAKYRVRVHTNHIVTGIDRKNQTVTVRNEKNEIITQKYDKLILSQGANPITPNIKGTDQPHVFTLRSLTDTDRIHDYILKQQPKHAVVIGGGFIGLEMAEAFHHLGMFVSVVEMADHILPPLDHDMAMFLTKAVLRERFAIHTSARATEITANAMMLDNGQNIPADIVLVSAGVKPETELALACDLTIGSAGGIVVDEHMQTSDAHIYAVGDFVEIKHRVSEKMIRMPLAGPANRQARIAAINAAGGKAKYRGVLGTAIVKIFDMVAGTTGLSESAAQKLGLNVQSSLTLDNNHAGYYPNAEMLRTKLVYESSSGRLLGAQVIGCAGVDKRLDVLATAIFAKLTVFDLEELDLCYAPPFGSANDPVNTAGFVAAHIVTNDVPNIKYEKDLPANAQLIDVRNHAEIKASGLLAGAIAIPLPQLRDRWHELDQTKPVVVYCAKGLRGYLALRILKGNGFANVSNINGGYPLAKINGWKTE